jgi:Zn-dependent peptidase ImmA (M78 family)
MIKVGVTMPKTVRVDINPKVIQWAINNSDFEYNSLIEKEHNLDEWLSGETKPTLKQLSKFSKMIHIPFGYLVLEKPPEETAINTDYRTIKDALVKRPSRNLYDTINDMEQKMLWMREYRISIGAEKLYYLGELSKRKENTDIAVNKIRELLGLRESRALEQKDFDETYNLLKGKIELKGPLVMKNSVVANNTHRALDINEFRAFTLYDEYSPVIFINGKDSKAGRIFSLIHEFCHLLVSDTDNILIDPDKEKERYCNQITSEFLMPKDLVLDFWKNSEKQKDDIKAIAKKLKVSSTALVRKLYDLKKVDYQTYKEIYEKSVEDFNKSKGSKKGSGNPYNTKQSNLSREFVKAVLISTDEGTTLYDEAYKLLNCRKPKTFEEFARRFLNE